MFIIKWVIKQIGTYWDVFSTVGGWFWAIGGGVMTGWAAWAAGILSAYAPFSWVGIGLIGALFCAGILWIIQKARLLSVQTALTKMWSTPGDGVNPLDDNFVRKRIKLNDFVSPIHPLIDGKTFDRCEILGPSLVLFGANLHSPNFLNCNFLCVKDGVTVQGAIQVTNCNFINCKFYQLSVLVPETVVPRFTVPGMFWLSRSPPEFGQPVPWAVGEAQLPAPQPSP